MNSPCNTCKYCKEVKEEEEFNKSETDGTVTIPLKRYLELLRIEQGR